MREVRRVETTWSPASVQNWLYVPTSPGRGAGSSARRMAACRSSAAASASARNAFSRRLGGRSNGVIVAFTQIPWRSGWPSVVRGGVQARGDAFGWAATAAAAKTAAAARASPICRGNRSFTALFTGGGAPRLRSPAIRASYGEARRRLGEGGRLRSPAIRASYGE